MTAPAATREPPTLLGALKALGWLPLMLMGLGGLSLISVLERAVLFHDLSLITPFEIALEGYHRVTELLGQVIEPIVQPAIDWLNAGWNWHLTLQPFWPSLFVVGMIYVLAMIRTGWRAGRWISSGVMLAFQGTGMLAGTVAAALAPPDGGWAAQGWIASIPMISNSVIGGIGAVLIFLGRQEYASARASWQNMPKDIIISSVVLFVLAAGLSLIPGFGAGAGIVSFASMIALTGMTGLRIGLKTGNRDALRSGLSILGGFVAAGLILISNWAVTAIS